MWIDLIRFGHIAGLALGLGLAIYADHRFLRTLTRPLRREDVDLLSTIHGHVVTALSVLWLTGIMLLYVRTGFQAENVTPKLVFKVLIVSVLTVNAVLIGRRVLLWRWFTSG